MISCNEYDYIEIVCMCRYPIQLTLRSGAIIECIALDTQRNEDREECIKVDVNGVEELVVLDGISKLVVCIENKHFQEVTFR
ncbi:Rho-binding antiterminator [Vibrio sp. Of7-15]|uniref:Rho-binding antiterminator n=1 Tax=Vibrio sp. Of7-15 TaxID=2724879 RepID=UPI001EF35EF1|nr:Rho-binding antiterminator [Vibrio sp. Of7-15]MCG7499650.1 Rho-binding antiterminator [Vibrio sp. Of7-15]